MDGIHGNTLRFGQVRYGGEESADDSSARECDEEGGGITGGGRNFAYASGGSGGCEFGLAGKGNQFKLAHLKRRVKGAS
jgi:hypothetical protein